MPGPACQWCGNPKIDLALGRFCSKKCRQTAHRLRRRRGIAAVGPASSPGVFALLDPPYLGKARRFYAADPNCREVNHRVLVGTALERGFMGFGLACSEASLRTVLPLCPEGSRVIPWVKPNGVRAQSFGLHNCWEALIIVGGRVCRPGIQDWLCAKPARGGGELMGRKPLAWCAKLFDALGMLPGDTFEDWFPGTGVVSRAWEYLTRKRLHQEELPLLDGARRPLLPGSADARAAFELEHADFEALSDGSANG